MVRSGISWSRLTSAVPPSSAPPSTGAGAWLPFWGLMTASDQYFRAASSLYTRMFRYSLLRSWCPGRTFATWPGQMGNVTGPGMFTFLPHWSRAAELEVPAVGCSDAAGSDAGFSRTMYSPSQAYTNRWMAVSSVTGLKRRSRLS